MFGLQYTIPIALGIALTFLGFFIWSVRKRMYDDPEMPKYKMLMDDKDDVDKEIKPKKPRT